MVKTWHIRDSDVCASGWSAVYLMHLYADQYIAGSNIGAFCLRMREGKQ